MGILYALCAYGRAAFGRKYLWVADPQVDVEIARKARDTVQDLLLPGAQRSSLHPFGDVKAMLRGRSHRQQCF